MVLPAHFRQYSDLIYNAGLYNGIIVNLGDDLPNRGEAVKPPPEPKRAEVEAETEDE